MTALVMAYTEPSPGHHKQGEQDPQDHQGQKSACDCFCSTVIAYFVRIHISGISFVSGSVTAYRVYHIRQAKSIPFVREVLKNVGVCNCR